MTTTRRAFCRAVGAGAAALGSGCSFAFDPDAYNQRRPDAGDAGGRFDGPLMAGKGSVLLVGGTLDGFNGGEATKEVFVARFDPQGAASGFYPQLQVSREARRYTARVDGDVVLVGCQGRFERSQLGPDGVIGWTGHDLPGVDGDAPTFAFAGPWLLAISGPDVQALRFADPKAQWTTQPVRLQTSRRGPTVQYTNGRLYVLGGANSESALTDGEHASFDEETGMTGTFAKMDSLPQSTYGCGLVFSGNQLYVIGGNRDGGTINQGFAHDSVYAATLAGNGIPGPWRLQPMLLTPLCDSSVWVRNDRVYVAGGRRGSGNPTSVLVGSAPIGSQGDLGAWDFQSHARLPRGRFNTYAVVV